MRERDAARAALVLAAALLGVALLRGGGVAPPPSGAPPPASGPARLLWGRPLDLNREPPGALEALPGVGPARAAAIAARRPYCGVDELREVPGIGPVTLERLRPRVAVRPPLPRRCAR